MCNGKKRTAAFIVIIGIVSLVTTGLSARICPNPPRAGGADTVLYHLYWRGIGRDADNVG